MLGKNELNISLGLQKKVIRLLPLLIVFCFFFQKVNAQFYQGSNVEFGKNRVQFKEFDWFYYPGKQFDVYYYLGGEQLANYTLRSCDKNLKGLQKFYDYAIEDRVQVITYLKQSEWRQSNIGITGDDQFNIGGAARIMGNKMFLYYEGDYQKYDRQINESLSRLIFTQMMYGGDWKDVVKSSTLLSMPKWYEEGMIRYAVYRGSEESDVFIRDLISRSKFKTMNRLYGEEAALGGEAFWKYISEVYGSSVIPSILYMTRVSRNMESGFLFVLGISIEQLNKDFIRYQKEKIARLKEEQIVGLNELGVKAKKRTMGQLPVRYKAKYRYSQFKLSPDETKLAYVTHEMGQYKIWIYDFEEKKGKRVLKREYRLDRIADESFPVLTWHPTSQTLTYVFEKKGRAFIGHYNLDEKDRLEKELFRIEKVTDLQYSKDGKRIIFSGVNRGFSDLYLYQVIGNNQEQLTNDIYDDVQARFIDNDQRIIFASNRPDDTLRKDVPIDLYPTERDIYIYDIASRSPLLERVTNTPGVNEHHPSGYSPKHYTYLSNENGKDNRYLATIDSAIAAIDTTVHYRYFTEQSLLSNFSRSPVDYQLDERSGGYSLVFKDRSRPLVVWGNRSTDKPLGSSLGLGYGNANDSGATIEQDPNTVKVSPPKKEAEVNIREYVYEDERKNYSHEKKTIRIQEVNENGEAARQDSVASNFDLPKSRNYRLNFATDFVLTQVDNSFTSAFYQNYGNKFNRAGTNNNDGPSSINPGISGLIKIGISDLFEDYKVVGGFRLSGSFQNNDYGISFENLKSRWDRKTTFMRQGQTQADVENYIRIHTHTLTHQWRFPFNELSSVRITLIGRQDRGVQLAIDPRSLSEKNFTEYNLGAKVDYVFDNTIARGLNLYNGTRFKAWYERYQRPDQLDKKSDINVVGFDFRHYHRIHRELIAAFRMAGATSFGQYRIVHYLGGVDNWLFQRIDNSIPIATDRNYTYQSFAGPMRGFYVNARNGNSFAMANAEVRWPIFKYLLNKPIKSDFVENFQIVSFFDVGSAWTGKSPYDESNNFNSVVVEQKPVTVTINNNREPIIYGYGFGLRSRVLGYFLRADWAWGVDDNQTLPRVFYLSMNLDF